MKPHKERKSEAAIKLRQVCCCCCCCCLCSLLPNSFISVGPSCFCFLASLYCARRLRRRVDVLQMGSPSFASFACRVEVSEERSKKMNGRKKKKKRGVRPYLLSANLAGARRGYCACQVDTASLLILRRAWLLCAVDLDFVRARSANRAVGAHYFCFYGVC